MKQLILLLVILTSGELISQESSGIKPGILINGSPCLIQNLVYSCVPRTCDSIVINAGDSLEFCTYQAIELNQDTAYWLQWQFTGATNLADTIRHVFPTATPLCHWPRWDTAGTFTVEVFYNGDLTAYPYCDCYPQGPSHWYIKVVVLPVPDGVEERGAEDFMYYPNPSAGIFKCANSSGGSRNVTVYNAVGMVLHVTNDETIDLSVYGSGIYFVTIVSGGQVIRQRLVVE